MSIFSKKTKTVAPQSGKPLKEKEPAEIKADVKDVKIAATDKHHVPIFQLTSVLRQPVTTEKTAFLGSQNQYIFEVNPTANKNLIKKAIENIYQVKVIAVNTLKMRGKKVRYGKSFGTTKTWKKALITLKAGDKIDLYEKV